MKEIHLKKPLTFQVKPDTDIDTYVLNTKQMQIQMMVFPYTTNIQTHTYI